MTVVKNAFKVPNRYLEKTITKSQRCQRNWDLTRHIPIEDIKTMKTAVTQCSSKQNRVFYKAVFITNRDIIERIYHLTNGSGYVKDEDFKTLEEHGLTRDQAVANDMIEGSKSHQKGKWAKKRYDNSHQSTNPQTLANLLVAFVRDRDPSEDLRTKEERVNGRQAPGSADEHRLVKQDEQVALGIGAGYLTLTSNILGYASGCCQCGDMKEISRLIGEREDTLLLMGIGYPDESRSRLEHHVTGRRFPTRAKNVLVEDVA